MEPRTAALICLAVIAVGGLLFIIGFSTTGWTVIELGGVKQEQGLWQLCQISIFGKRCGRITRSPDSFKATQAMMCLALIAYGVAVVANVLILVKGSAMARLLTTAGSAGATLFIFIAVMIFGIESKDGSKYLNYSYALTVVSGLFAGANAILVQILIKPAT